MGNTNGSTDEYGVDDERGNSLEVCINGRQTMMVPRLGGEMEDKDKERDIN